MYTIVKEVNGNKYYWNKEKFCWYGLVNNGSKFTTELLAIAYKAAYPKLFKDSQIKPNDVL